MSEATFDFFLAHAARDAPHAEALYAHRLNLTRRCHKSCSVMVRPTRCATVVKAAF